jgi:hypothetical protein
MGKPIAVNQVDAYLTRITTSGPGSRGHHAKGRKKH